MKIKKPSVKAVTGTTLTCERTATIRHGQSVKQSFNYQTVEAHYSIERTVPDETSAIAAGVQLIEAQVENMLQKKLTQQRKLLQELGDANA